MELNEYVDRAKEIIKEFNIKEDVMLNLLFKITKGKKPKVICILCKQTIPKADWNQLNLKLIHIGKHHGRDCIDKHLTRIEFIRELTLDEKLYTKIQNVCHTKNPARLTEIIYGMTITFIEDERLRGIALKYLEQET